MEAFSANELWLICTAILFTGIGYMMGFNHSTRRAVERTIDVLIEQGYIRSRKNADGSTEILKHNDRS